MKITIESTSKTVVLEGGGKPVTARVWEGATEDGIQVHCLIVRIAHDINEPAAVADRFAAQLTTQRAPTPAVDRAYDLRMFL